jgi:hypothetical protein
VWWVDGETVAISQLTGGKAPLAPDGAVALDSSGDLLAVEARGRQILIVHARGAGPELFKAGVWPVCALALNSRAGLLAAGAPDGRIALHRVSSGKLDAELAMETESLTALAFSADGFLLAAGDDDGHVVVYQISPSQELHKIDAGRGIRALPLYDEGFPVLVGDAKGRVTAYRRALPPTKLTASDGAVASLACPPLTSGEPVVGWDHGTIGRVDLRHQRIIPCLHAGGPVRALRAGSSGRVLAVVAGPELTLRSSNSEIDLTEAIRDLPGVLSDVGEVMTGQLRQLRSLVTNFAEVRERMRDDIAAERSEMLDRLSLDQATRDRIRPVVVDSAVSIFNSYSFDMAVRKIFEVDLLPEWLLGIAGALLFFLLLLLASGPLESLGHLRGTGAWVTVVAIVAGATWITRRLGRLGAVGRAGRALFSLAAVVVALAGTQVTLTEPRTVGHLVTRWFPAAGHLAFRAAIPYPVWLGAAYVALLVVVRTLTRWALSSLRAPGTLALRRQVLGASLLHALLDVAYQAQVMADDGKLASWSGARTALQKQVRLAARIASREWVAALRTGSSQADRIIRDQGHAIAAAIRRWERPAVLAGAQLPRLSQAFAVAVVNAADNDWQELAGNPAAVPARHPRIRMLVRQGLTLAVPLGAAVGIVLGVRPLPTAVVPLLTFLVGLAVARVLRWLDFSTDIDPALTISDLLRKPH